MQYKIRFFFTNRKPITRLVENVSGDMEAHCMGEVYADEYEKRGMEVVYVSYQRLAPVKTKGHTQA